jgi:hypothetical protein
MNADIAETISPREKRHARLISGDEESDRLPVILRAAFSLDPSHQPT